MKPTNAPAGEARDPGGVQHAPFTVVGCGDIRAIRLMPVERVVIDATQASMSSDESVTNRAHVLLHRNAVNSSHGLLNQIHSW